MNWEVLADYDEVSENAASLLLGALRDDPSTVLGLPTGRTPEGMYRRVVAACRREYHCFSRATTFNLDEYVGVPRSHPGSYFNYMKQRLFDHVELDPEHFSADVMGQTLAMSNPDQWAIGRTVNLERAAAVGDRLGGHIVQGHIDGTSRVIEIRDEGTWRVLRFSLDATHAPLVVDKGSIAIDGISLTVSAAGHDWFEVSLIPETLTRTTLGARQVGDLVNIETDILARHVARLAQFGIGASAGSAGTPDGDAVDNGRSDA